MSDIVEMLRTPTGCVPPTKWELAAADEIERLRAATPAVGGEARDKIAVVIGKQYFADFEEDACSCAQCEAEREACRKLADQVIALAQPTSPLRDYEHGYADGVEWATVHASPAVSGERERIARLVCCGHRGCQFVGDSEDGEKCWCDTTDFNNSGIEKTVDAILALAQPASPLRGMLPSADWLRSKVATDPDLDCEASSASPFRGTAMTAQRALEISANIAEDRGWIGNTGAEIAKAIRDVAERGYWTRTGGNKK